MLHEVDHLKDLTSDMENLCRNPKQLPTSTEQLIQDFIAANDHLAPPPVIENKIMHFVIEVMPILTWLCNFNVTLGARCSRFCIMSCMNESHMVSTETPYPTSF